MTMITISEAKAHFSKYVKKALAGKDIRVCDRNTPVIKISVLILII